MNNIELQNKGYAKYDMNNIELEDKRYAKDPNHFEYAKLKIFATEESDLHELTLMYIKTLNYNGAWDFDIKHIDNENLNIVTFKYNGTITALDAISKLHFQCMHKIKHTIKSEWRVNL